MEQKDKMELISKVLDRATELGLITDKLSSLMDLDFADKDTPMNFDGLLTTDVGNFIHDFVGIRENLNRKTKKIENCFVPRFAAKYSEQDETKISEDFYNLQER